MTNLFDHVNAIYTNQHPQYFDNLEDAEKKSFNVYMINRFLSMNPQYVQIVNELQTYYGSIGSREAYLFYSNIIPKKRQFYKYVKSSAKEAYEPWLIELVAKHFQVSTTEAEKYIELYLKTEIGTTYLAQLCSGYGIEQKVIDKALG